MKDYQLNEKIIPAKIDSFEWIQRSLDYKYQKAIRSWNDLNGGKIIFILYHFVAPDYWYNMFFLCADSPLIFEIGDLKTTDIDWTNDVAWTAGQYIDYYNFWRNTSPEEFVDLENDPEYASISNDYKPFHFLTKNYPSCRVIKATSYTRQAVLLYLRDTYYDQMDLELKPLPDYYSEGELLSVDEYGSKIIEKHSKLTEEEEAVAAGDVGWWTGQFPLTPHFHMVFWDGNSYFLPDGTMIAELSQRYAENTFNFANQYIIVRPTSRILSRYLYFILPRRGISAYSRAGNWEEPNYQQVQQIRNSFKKMEFQVNLWAYGTPRFIIHEILKYLQISDPGDVTNKPYLYYISSPEDFYAIVDRFNSLNQLDVISSLLVKIGGAL